MKPIDYKSSNEKPMVIPSEAEDKYYTFPLLLKFNNGYAVGYYSDGAREPEGFYMENPINKSRELIPCELQWDYLLFSKTSKEDYR